MESYADAVQIRVVHRAVDLVHALGQRPQGASVSELASLLDMPKSSVYRLLVTLRRADWVTFQPETERYRLGLGLLEVSASVLDGLSLRALAQPHLEALWRHCNESVHLGLLHDTTVVYVLKYESTHSIRMYSEVGKRAPVHCTGLGKALLAWMPDHERQRFIAKLDLRRFTATTLTSPGVLEADLTASRERGYTIDSGEHEEFVRCVAAPVMGSDGPVGAVSIAGPAFRMTSERLVDLGACVRDQCRQLSTAITGVQAARIRT